MHRAFGRLQRGNLLESIWDSVWHLPGLSGSVVIWCKDSVLFSRLFKKSGTCGVHFERVPLKMILV